MTGFPIPILFAVQSLRGKARVRMQVIPEPPFVKTVVFGFQGCPQVEINAYVRPRVPLNPPLPSQLDSFSLARAPQPLRGPIDVMSIPLLNNYAQSTIEAVLNKFVLPRHYALDLRKFMLGGDVPLSTYWFSLCLSASLQPAPRFRLISFLSHAPHRDAHDRACRCRGTQSYTPPGGRCATRCGPEPRWQVRPLRRSGLVRDWQFALPDQSQEGHP